MIGHPARRALHEEDGFTLTELMIAIVIIGILALLAIPRFMSVTTDAKMTEAKMMLRHLQSLQEVHYYAADAYAADLAAVGFEQTPLVTAGGTARYRIAVERADAAGYLATATAVVDFDNDGTFNVWEVDHTGSIRMRTPD
jgi:type IV pilus assembly protein PilE